MGKISPGNETKNTKYMAISTKMQQNLRINENKNQYVPIIVVQSHQGHHQKVGLRFWACSKVSIQDSSVSPFQVIPDLQQLLWPR